MPNLTRQIVRRLSDDDARLTEQERHEWTGPARGCRVIRTTAATIQNITVTTMAYSTAMFDRGGCWSPAVSTRLIAPRDGIYAIDVNIGWNNASDTDGARLLQIYDKAGNVLAADSKHGSADAYIGQHIGAKVHMDKADYVVVKVYQASGAAMLVSTASVANQHLNHASLTRVD